MSNYIVNSNQNIILYKGSSFEYEMIIKRKDQDVTDLTGKTVEAFLIPSYLHPETSKITVPVTVMDSLNGKYKLVFSDEFTSALNLGTSYNGFIHLISGSDKYLVGYLELHIRGY